MEPSAEASTLIQRPDPQASQAGRGQLRAQLHGMWASVAPAGAELADIAVTEVSTPLRDASFDAWWTRTSALAGPLAKRLSALPESARRQLRAGLEAAVRPYQTATGLDFPGVSLLASARRAGVVSAGEDPADREGGAGSAR